MKKTAFKCSRQDMLSIAINAAFSDIIHFPYFWERDDCKIFKYFYLDSISSANRYVCGEEYIDNEDIQSRRVYEYLPDFFIELEQRMCCKNNKRYFEGKNNQEEILNPVKSCARHESGKDNGNWSDILGESE